MDYHDLRTPILNAQFAQNLSESDRTILADILTTILEDESVSTKDPASEDTGAVLFSTGDGSVNATILPHEGYTPDGDAFETMLFSWTEFEGMAKDRIQCGTPLRERLTANGAGKDESV